MTNTAGSWIMWQRIWLVAAAPGFAWGRLVERDPLPPVAAALLAASLGSALIAAIAPARARSRARLLLLGAGVAGGAAVGFGAPRWVWLALPCVGLALATETAARSAPRRPASAGRSAGPRRAESHWRRSSREFLQAILDDPAQRAVLPASIRDAAD